MRSSFVLKSAGVCLLAAAFIGAATNESRETEGSQMSSPPEIAVVPQRPSEVGPVQMIRFVVFDTGIYPRELAIDKGLVNFALEDKTHGVTALVVERVEGSQVLRVGEIHRTVNHSRGRGIIKLTPGRYELYEASRPAKKSVLTVKP